MKNIKKRIILYLLGLFIIALGIAMAAKSDFMTLVVLGIATAYLLLLMFGIFKLSFGKKSCLGLSQSCQCFQTVSLHNAG